MNPMTPPAAAGDRSAPALSAALLTMLELNRVNGYTGAAIVTQGESRGTIYFTEGKVVHAVAGLESGEAALRAILGWAQGEYLLDDEAVAPRTSIARDVEEVLADARANRPPRGEVTVAPLRPAPAPGRRASLSEIAEQARQLPGVACAVLHDPDGAPIGPAPLSPLEEQALCLGRLAKALGGILKAGPLVLGIVHGSMRNVLLLTSKERQLTLLIEAGSQGDAAQAQIRKLLGAQV